jgi:5'-phosphate synthase pdxT subunit
MTQPTAIGVLDLQGGVQEHLDHLRRIGVVGKAVKQVDDFNHLAGLIIPGGESTCLARLLKIFSLHDVIVREYQRGLKLWGTCAGAILLAQENSGDTAYLGLIDIAVQRNAFGSQLDSFQCHANVPRVSPDPVPLTFIRAPKITRVGVGVSELIRINDYVAAAEDEQTLVTVFHPELTSCLAFHRYFAKKCGLLPTVETDIDTTWERQAWMRAAPG